MVTQAYNASYSEIEAGGQVRGQPRELSKSPSQKEWDLAQRALRLHPRYQNAWVHRPHPRPIKQTHQGWHPGVTVCNTPCDSQNEKQSLGWFTPLHREPRERLAPASTTQPVNGQLGTGLHLPNMWLFPIISGGRGRQRRSGT